MKSKYVKYPVPKFKFRYSGDWVTAYGGRTFYWQWFIKELDKHYDQHFRVQIWFNGWRLPTKIKLTYPRIYSRCEAKRYLNETSS